MTACFKFQSILNTVLCKCTNDKIFPFCVMPKRPSHNLPPYKKIKLNTNLMKNIDITRSKTSSSNLQTVKVFPKMTISDSKMTLSNANNKSEVQEFEIEYLNTPIKSESDKKEYRVIKLKNGLTALLISDVDSVQSNQDIKAIETGSSALNADSDDSCSEEEESSDNKSETNSLTQEESDSNAEESNDEDTGSAKAVKKEEKMAACGLCIGVGSFSDPLEIQGMAHFLEHMVFMGSEKYPEENDFENFIQKRGGSDNACTDCEQTTFYFEIQEKYLYPAIDRFAQFFIHPLMKRDTIAREREAVESEFRMALPSDSNRKEQLFCSLARKDHPAKKFPWGNLATLRDNIDEDTLYSELHKFRERHYSAHRMTLAVQARLSLDTLEQYVKDCFSNVPVNHLPADDFREFIGKNSFDNPDFRKLYKIKPIKDVCQVELTWVMPPLHHLYKSKPHQYVSWIIGHEGKGSLISYLRKKMWAIDIFSGNSEGGFEHSSMYALFSLSLILTDEGHKCFNNVLEAVFSYINMLQCVGPQRRIFDEIQQVEKINFRFTDEDDPVDYVESLCENMHFYPPEHYITGSDLYYDYDPKSIKDCISALCPDNVNIIVFDKKFNEEEFDQVEPWFQTKYSSSEIPNEWVEHWKRIEPFPEFHLPKPNIFIADDFSLINLPDVIPEYPMKIHADEKHEIWYRVDPKFRLPECHIYLHLITPFATESAKTSGMLSIFIALLKYLAVEDLYDASTAELNYEIFKSDKGIVIKVYGLNQKLPLLLKTVLKYFSDVYKLVNVDLFNVIKKEQLKDCYNTFLKPSRLVKEVRLSILTAGIWSSTEKHAAISEVTFEDFIQFADRLTDHLFIQSLVQGNMSQNEIKKCISEALQPLQSDPLMPNIHPQITVTKIPQGDNYCKVKNFNPMDVNSVITNYYQSGLLTIENSVIVDLLMLIMEEPLFNQLRTQEHLGYNVFCLANNTFGVLGYSISVCTQANKFMTEHVNERIEKFIQTLKKNLYDMSYEEYNLIKESLIKNKRCTDIHLKEEVNRNWGEIICKEYTFDRLDKEIAAINALEIDEFRQWVSDHTADGKNFRKLSVQVAGVTNLIKENINEGENEGIPGKFSLTFLKIEKNGENEVPDNITDIRTFKSHLPTYVVNKNLL